MEAFPAGQHNSRLQITPTLIYRGCVEMITLRLCLTPNHILLLGFSGSYFGEIWWSQEPMARPNESADIVYQRDMISRYLPYPNSPK